MCAFRLIAPAGAPLPMRAILLSKSRSLGDSLPLEEHLSRRLERAHLFLLCSGRAALTVLLKVLKRCSSRQEVVIPAYTCFSVASAVARAGLKIRLCDVDQKTLDLDHRSLLQLDLGKALCVIPSGLYGLPGDLMTLEDISRDSGAFLVDDAAQCLGAALHGKACGTFGDAGFYSLGRGKNITAMGGGILVTHREDLTELIRQEVGQIPVSPTTSACSAAVSALFYGMMLRPSRYWILDRVPFLGLGASRFEPHFPIAQLSPYQRRLAGRILPLLDLYNGHRRNVAEWLRRGIEGVEGVEIPHPVPGAEPIYLRFPILARDETQRSRLLRRLRHAGIAASASYPTAIGNIPGIDSYLAQDQQPCPGARSIAKRIITLPTHPYVTPLDVEKIVAIIRQSYERPHKANA